MKRGAVDYISKPFNNDELLLVVRRALGEKQLQDENLYLRQELAGKYTFANIIGKGSRMQEIFRSIERIGKVSSTVLLTGESGTGKELIARAIHFSSIRRDKKFVSINCGALPESLLESELFGHERGRLHGRGAREARPLPGGRRRDALPGRDLGDDAHDAGQAAAGDPGEADPEGRRQRRDLGRRPHHRGDQQGPDRPGRGGQIPRGPLLPHQRHPDPAASAALAHRGHPAADLALHHADLQGAEDPGEEDLDRGDAPARGLPVAGQRARAREHAGAHGRPGGRARDQRVEPSRGDRPRRAHARAGFREPARRKASTSRPTWRRWASG